MRFRDGSACIRFIKKGRVANCILSRILYDIVSKKCLFPFISFTFSPLCNHASINGVSIKLNFIVRDAFIAEKHYTVFNRGVTEWLNIKKCRETCLSKVWPVSTWKRQQIPSKRYLCASIVIACVVVSRNVLGDWNTTDGWTILQRIDSCTHNLDGIKLYLSFRNHYSKNKFWQPPAWRRWWRSKWTTSFLRKGIETWFADFRWRRTWSPSKEFVEGQFS